MKKLFLGDMSWPEADQRIREARAVILPLGSTEQHGYHMTLDTDNIVGNYMAEELARRTDCVYLPCVNYGQVWSAKDFPATIQLKERTLIELIKDIVESLENKGARNIILFASHWGNTAPCKLACRELLDEQGYDNVYHLSYTNLKKTGEGIMESELWNGSGFHAGEIETSILLQIRPASVDMSKAIREYPPVPPDVNIRPIHWIDFCKSGIFGDASIATAEKGKAYLDRWISELEKTIIENIT